MMSRCVKSTVRRRDSRTARRHPAPLGVDDRDAVADLDARRGGQVHRGFVAFLTGVALPLMAEEFKMNLARRYRRNGEPLRRQGRSWRPRQPVRLFGS